MVVAIASTRGPKVEAAKQILAKIGPYLSDASSPIEYLTHEVEGGTSMPRTLGELMEGASGRVAVLRQRLHQFNQRADYLLGMEGGFHVIVHEGAARVYLQSWAYVSDGAEGFYGSSGNVLVPEKIAREVMEGNRDLAEVIDGFSRAKDIRSREGTWGVLTKNLLTRQQSFETALAAAFAPFYNREAYQSRTPIAEQTSESPPGGKSSA